MSTISWDSGNKLRDYCFFLAIKSLILRPVLWNTNLCVGQRERPEQRDKHEGGGDLQSPLLSNNIIA